MKYLLISFLINIFLIGPILPQSLFNKALDVDGDGDYGNTFNSPYFPTVNGTIEAWVKVRNIAPPGNLGDVFISKNEEQWNTGDFYVYFEYTSGLLKSRIQASPSVEIDVVSNNNFWQQLGYWFHYAFTWGASGMKMYINGVKQNNQNSVTYSALNNTYNFYVGAHGYMLHNGSYVVSEFFDGQIDELRLWNYQKTEEEILDLWDAPLDSSYYTTIDSGLVGYWKFDILENLGVNNDGVDDVRDFSVLHNHLDLAGDAHLVSSDIIVPVDLVSFIATPLKAKVRLEWETATELNNYGFEIERKTENLNWRSVSFVEGKGTTAETQHYSFIDDLFGVNELNINYRLRQIDFDGSFEYSNEVTVKVSQPKEYYLSQNYPNPFNPTTTINYSLAKDGFVSIKVYDILGNEVLTLVNSQQQAGNHNVVFEADNLSSGIYYYQLKSGDFTDIKKLVLIK